MKKYVKVGFGWGLCMFAFMTFVDPLIDGSEITLKKVLIGLVIWSIAGLFFGWAMKGNYKEES